MRLKEFCIFLVIFTVFYIAFFLVFDVIKDKVEKEKYEKYIMSLVQLDKYLAFARFYGINGVATKELILQILHDFREEKNRSLSATAAFYQLSPFELIVVLLYLEYYSLIPKRNISTESDSIIKASHVDLTMIQKYFLFMQKKSDLHTIMSSAGSNALTELTYLNQHFLLPGVRLMDSSIYYVGDFL